MTIIILICSRSSKNKEKPTNNPYRHQHTIVDRAYEN